MFKVKFATLGENGDITKEDAKNFENFLDMAGVPSLNAYIFAKLGHFKHMEGDAGYEAAKKVMEKLGLSDIEFNKHTSMPYEQQFWEQFDIIMQLSEEEMMRELPLFVTDPANKSKIEAILEGRRKEFDQESTKAISAGL